MQSLKLKPSLIKLNKSERLYELNIPLIGLTGGIASGKSTVSNLLIKDGLAVIDADKLIHDIYLDNEVVKLIKYLAPAAVQENAINFKSLREIFFAKQEVKEKVVNTLYQKLPLYFNNEVKRFQASKVIIYDVPLLFENHLQDKMDLTITVYADRKNQLARVLSRDQISIKLANKILDQQMDIEIKRNMADYTLNNTGNLDSLITEYQLLRSKLFI